VVGIPDGPTPFEIAVAEPATTVAFTAEPLACAGSITFKASFDGRTYVAQPTFPSDNDCATAEPCPVSGVTGYFEPVQAVFQDDPLAAANHVPDTPGKRLLRTSPTSLTAELPMVRGKPSLLYGIDHTQQDTPADRDHIVIRGMTTGTTAVPVAMHFSGTLGVSLIHTTPVLGQILLDGPCGPAAPFEISVDARDGIWPRTFPPFIFALTGPYEITNELTRADGGQTGIKVTVTGTVVETSMPTVAFVPMVLDPFAPPKALDKDAARLRTASMTFIPDFYPIVPGSLRGVLGLLIDARARTRAERDSWGTWAASIVGEVSDFQLTTDVALAALADWASTAAVLGDIGRTVVVLSDRDVELLNRGTTPRWDGLALGQKVVLV
jgi:hypothetical protein